MDSIQQCYVTPSKNFSSLNNERDWVTQIRQAFDDVPEEDNDIDSHVSIFNVPKMLIAVAPDLYTPQQVAIGPYHFWRPELYDMERHKLSAAKRTQKNYFLNNLKFRDIVQNLTIQEPRIRGYYHKYLDLSAERLAWMMAIDASFLLEFLYLYAIELEGSKISTSGRRISPRMSYLLNLQRQKPAHNAILKDVIMLENQIPLFILRKVLELQYETLEKTDYVLSLMLLGFFRELSPLKIIEGGASQISGCSHLLDFFYKMVTPQLELSKRDENIIDIDEELYKCENQGIDENKCSFGNSFRRLRCIMLRIFCTIGKILGNINQNHQIKSFMKQFFLKLPLRVLSYFPRLGFLARIVEIYFLPHGNIGTKLTESQSTVKPPLIEEITIPSVTDLSKSSINFSPKNSDLSTLSFDTKTATFYLPIISLDSNTEAILRNLVAYEASIASGPLIFTRYTELMNGIIDTDKDVKLLREKGIILNRLKSDGEVVDLWNGMSKSIRLTKVPFLDKVIEDVNKYHDEKWKVKFGKFLRKHVFGSWQFLTLLAVVWILFLLGFRVFCVLSTCPRFISSACQ